MPNCTTCCDVPNGKDLYNPKCQDCLVNELACVISGNIQILMNNMARIYDQLDNIKDLMANSDYLNVDTNLIPCNIIRLRRYLKSLLPDEPCLYEPLDETLVYAQIHSSESGQISGVPIELELT